MPGRHISKVDHTFLSNQSLNEENQVGLTCPVFRELPCSCSLWGAHEAASEYPVLRPRPEPTSSSSNYSLWNRLTFWKIKTAFAPFNFPAALPFSRFHWSRLSVCIFSVSQFLGEIVQTRGFNSFWLTYSTILGFHCHNAVSYLFTSVLRSPSLTKKTRTM